MKSVTTGFLFRQAAVIVFLTAAGLSCNLCLPGKKKLILKLLLAFPLGLALYAVTGFAVLLLGIPFNAYSMSILLFLVCLAVIVYSIRKGECHKPDRDEAAKLAIFLVIAAAAALFCSSGILSVTIDNDSVYYYSTYPEIIAKTGKYLKYFDTFMTDVGQTSAVLNTLPFIYGFDNTFGIQHFMNLNFLALFVAAMVELLEGDSSNITADKVPIGRFRPSAVAAVLAALFMAGSYPFLFISKWVMSNVYFMEYFCIILIVVLLGGEELRGFGFTLFVMIAMLSMLRVEGVVVCGVLALCLSSLKLSKKTLASVFVLPVLILQCGFYAMLYLRMGVDPVYSFLDVKKALAITLSLAALLVYILLIRDRMLKAEFIHRYYRMIIILVLLFGNIVFLAVNPDRYISNLLTIYRNIRLGHGWGYFGIFMVIAAIFIAADILRSRFAKIEFLDFIWVCFILTVIAACWARGGMLRMGVGDSGNRIMMETVPLTVAVIAQKCYRLYRSWR